MLSTTISGKACWLLTAHPGDNAVKTSIVIGGGVEIERGLTGAQNRKADDVLPRWATTWQSTMSGAEFQALRNASLSAQDEPILAPLWLFARSPSAGAVIDAGLVVAFTWDWSSWAVNPVSFDGYDQVVPLIYGRFRQPPKLGAVNGEWVTAEFSVIEDAPVTLAVKISGGVLAGDVMFATVGGYSAPIFPFAAAWNSLPRPGVAITETLRQNVGPGRESSGAFYPQIPERTLSAHFRQFGPRESAELAAWWIRRGGEADSHWVIDAQSPWTLAANVSAGANQITLGGDAPMPISGGNIALSSGTVFELARISSIAGRTLTLSAALANSWTGAARVTEAWLARHTNQQLEITSVGLVADAEFAWREVAAEYTVPGDETRGETLGRTPGTAWFFKIELDYNGAIRTWNLTNWASGGTVNLTNWTYNACDFDSLTKSVDAEDDSFSLEFRYFAGGPWDNWLPGRLSARGWVTIYRCDVATDGALSDFRQVMKGELLAPSSMQPQVKQKALGANALFARQAFRQIMSTTCGTMLFRSRCGLNIADWQFSAEVVGITDGKLIVNSIGRMNGDSLPAGFGGANWFAFGWVQWTESGAPIRAAILASAAISGGQIALTLERTKNFPPGFELILVPGCNRRAETCSAKFDNEENFQGYKRIPSTSPSFVIPQETPGGGKKG